MPVNPRFLAARAAESRQRDLAHLRALCWVPLKRHGVIFTRSPIVPLTRRHRIELTLANNAFFGPQPHLLGDVFLFLWRLHPHYRAPRFGRESVIAQLDLKRARFFRLWFALGSHRSAALHRRLTRCVRRCDLRAAVASIHAFFDVTYQDAPGEDTGKNHDGVCRRSAIAPARQASDNRLDWLMSTYRMSHEEALDFPIALEHQLYREREFNEPDGELRIFAPSDLLLSES